MDKLIEFGKLVRNAERGVAFTGAGISTESGIPDYRGPQGVWNTETPVYSQDFMPSREGGGRGVRGRGAQRADTLLWPGQAGKGDAPRYRGSPEGRPLPIDRLFARRGAGGIVP